MDTNEDYYRQYLDDPTSVNNAQTPQQTDVTKPPDTNETYYREYLNDPNA